MEHKTNAADGNRHEPGTLAPNWMSANVPNGFTLVAVGDLIITDAIYARLQRQSPDLIDLLKNADVTFGNFEGTAIDLQKFGTHLRQCSRQRRLAVVHVTNRADVDVRLGAFEFTLCHDLNL